MNREYHKWFSHRLDREMELLIFGHKGRAVLFFPTRMARFYDYENWGIVNALREQINRGELQLFCIDSVDSESFYNTAVHPGVRIARHLQYEDYIINEVIPLIYNKNGSGYIETAGCSMGAYHAINLAMKYPWLFNKAVGISGRYDLTKTLGTFKDLLDGHHDKNVYFNMPAQYLPNLSDSSLLNALRGLELILVIGETDPFFQSNMELRDTLRSKNISNQCHVWGSYAHKPHYWRQMLPLYL
ncbi:MAG: esterase family protein [Pedobacter sp.]|nr:esterase family protein [Pedobacter sp.]